MIKDGKKVEQEVVLVKSFDFFSFCHPWRDNKSSLSQLVWSTVYYYNNRANYQTRENELLFTVVSRRRPFVVSLQKNLILPPLDGKIILGSIIKANFWWCGAGKKRVTPVFELVFKPLGWDWTGRENLMKPFFPLLIVWRVHAKVNPFSRLTWTVHLH